MSSPDSHATPPPASHVTKSEPRPSRALVEIVLVWVAFFVYSTLHAPPPATGEPHYLSKARHFYDPDWVRGDLFLESTDTHVVLYAAFGWLMLFFSPETTIWIGRVAATGLVASGWTLSARQIVGRRWAGLASASLHCAIASAVNLSGEWMLDGFEGRVLGYGMLFLGWGLGLKGRWIAAATALGGAIAMHPVVGGWGCLATVGGGLFAWAATRRSALRTISPETVKSRTEMPAVTPRVVCFAATGFLLTASAGILPALRAVGGSDGPRADAIQVFYRLAHHLDPAKFHRHAWYAYGAMLAGWLIVRRWEVKPPAQRLTALEATDATRSTALDSGCASEAGGLPRAIVRHWWLGCVLSSVVFFACGVAIAWGPRPVSDANFPMRTLRTRLLKFYPFRLADMLVPTAVAFTATTLAFRFASNRLTARTAGSAGEGGVSDPIGSRGERFPDRLQMRSRLVVAAFALTYAFGFWNGWVHRVRPPIATRRISAWRDVCAWVKASTPRDAVFVTPQVSWAFKWFAERPEYVSYKDCPQDAAGIVEWNRRLLLLDEWATEEFHDGYSVEALAKLRKRTGATHLVARDLGPFAVEPIYRNDVYQVLELPEATKSSEP